MARLWFLSDKNINGRYFDIDSAINLLAYPSQKFPSKFPLWIKVSYEGLIESNHVFLLEAGLRFHSQSLMHNKETGHPPFESIL